MFLYLGQLIFSFFEHMLISLELIDGYCYKSTKKNSSQKHSNSSSKGPLLASVFPDKETMEQVKEILRNTTR